MLTPQRALRRGVTLIELIVAMAVGGVVLALVAAISVRQQRIYADVADRSALAAQLRQAATILPIDLRALSPAAGDIREARDTSIELRATIASAVACDTLAGALVLAPSVTGETTVGSYVTPVAAGDTAWTLAPNDSGDVWLAYAIESVASGGASDCAPIGPRLSASERTANRVAIRLVGSPPLTNLLGAPLRVTRLVRYSLYRGGDGRWYLGQRDWNTASLRFNTIQPVSGPFSSPASRGVLFQYSDSAGVLLPSPVADSRAVTLVRIELRGQSQNAMRAFAAGSQGKSSDSLRLAVAVRNRR